MRSALVRAAVSADADIAEAKGRVVIMVLGVLLKLGLALVAAVLTAKSLMPPVMRLLQRHGSHELNQIGLVAWCFTAAWVSNSFGLSSELGAFVAGVMVSVASSANAAAALSASNTGVRSPGLAAVAIAGEDDSGAHACQSIESVRNVLVTLFMASIGLIMSPRCVRARAWGWGWGWRRTGCCGVCG